MAIDKQDTKALASCFAKEFAFTAIDQTTVTNAAQVNAFFNKMFKDANAPLTKMKIEPAADIFTRFIAPNAGYCYGSSAETYTLQGGRSFTMTNRWTALVVKEDGTWKVAAVHSGINFMNNPVLTASSMSTFRRIGIWLGICTPPWQEAP